VKFISIVIEIIIVVDNCLFPILIDFISMMTSLRTCFAHRTKA